MLVNFKQFWKILQGEFIKNKQTATLFNKAGLEMIKLCKQYTVISEINAYTIWEKISSRIKVQQDVALEVF